jgi:hypothetical protein
MNTAVGLMEMRCVFLYNITNLFGNYKDDKVTKYGEYNEPTNAHLYIIKH